MLELLFFLSVAILIMGKHFLPFSRENKYEELYVNDVPIVEYVANMREQENLLKTNTTTTKRVTYRPSTFKEYIGQEKAKGLLSRYIKASKERDFVFPHLLISGKAGMGKTTLVQIIASELGVKVVDRSERVIG